MRHKGIAIRLTSSRTTAILHAVAQKFRHIPQHPPSQLACTLRTVDLSATADAETVCVLLDSYARHEIGTGAALPAAVLEALPAALGAMPGVLVLLADVGAKPVGLAVCLPSFSTFTARPVLNIHDLMVLPDFRRRGIATHLLDAALRHARARGCAKITLEVREENVAGRGLYRRFGFTGDASTEPRRTFFLERSCDDRPA